MVVFLCVFYTYTYLGKNLRYEFISNWYEIYFIWTLSLSKTQQVTKNYPVCDAYKSEYVVVVVVVVVIRVRLVLSANEKSSNKRTHDKATLISTQNSWHDRTVNKSKNTYSRSVLSFVAIDGWKHRY